MIDYNTLIFNIGVFITAVFLLDYGADKFVDHTAIVAQRLGVSQTLVALLTAGAEWEELAVVIAAVVQKNAPLALGNVIGSVISNILAAFSLGLLFQHGVVRFDKSSKIYVTLLLVLTPPVLVLGYFGKGRKVFGGILIAVFVLYVISISVAIYRGAIAPPKREDSDDGEDNDSDSGTTSPRGSRHGDLSSATPAQDRSCEAAEVVEAPSLSAHQPDDNVETSPLPNPEASRHHPRPLLKHVLQLILGFLALSLSGYILSHSATSIADQLNISGTVYGITILAFAATLPEKFVAIIGARRGHVGIVVANTAGSNIFLLTLCLGVVYVSGNEARTITPFELAVALASVIAFAVIVYVGARRWMGGLLVVGYVVFFVLEFTVFRREPGFQPSQKRFQNSELAGNGRLLQ